ncbi:hypothetical protein MRB53_037695 [Persea americana]|nr:hypothetical protein MRB53_037695 [Persea americana]
MQKYTSVAKTGRDGSGYILYALARVMFLASESDAVNGSDRHGHRLPCRFDKDDMIHSVTDQNGFHEIRIVMSCLELTSIFIEASADAQYRISNDGTTLTKAIQAYATSSNEAGVAIRPNGLRSGLKLTSPIWTCRSSSRHLICRYYLLQKNECRNPASQDNG